MEKEELLEKFPVGCKVELISHYITEALGEIGTVIDYLNSEFINIIWDNKYCPINNGEYFPNRFKLFATQSLTPQTKTCPKCKEELIEKISEYTNSTIEKCKSCGWC